MGLRWYMLAAICSSKCENVHNLRTDVWRNLGEMEENFTPGQVVHDEVQPS